MSLNQTANTCTIFRVTTSYSSNFNIIMNNILAVSLILNMNFDGNLFHDIKASWRSLYLHYYTIRYVEQIMLSLWVLKEALFASKVREISTCFYPNKANIMYLSILFYQNSILTYKFWCQFLLPKSSETALSVRHEIFCVC